MEAAGKASPRRWQVSKDLSGRKEHLEEEHLRKRDQQVQTPRGGTTPGKFEELKEVRLELSGQRG